MNRERNSKGQRSLKFRAWVNGHWVDWIPTCKTLGAYNASVIDTDGYTYEKDNPFIVEQCTGLKDKNGKEIYEGDILLAFGFCRKYAVEWSEKYAAFETIDLTDGGMGPSIEFTAKYATVIGNIHENPELLGGKK